ncbi:MAG: peptidylprolyl isomerase [bacterium]
MKKENRKSPEDKMVRKGITSSIAVFLFIILCLFIVSSLGAKVVDKTVATVDGDVILMSEYEKRAKPVIEEYEKLLTGPDREIRIKELKEKILEQMIDEKILIHEAKKKEVRVNNKEIQDGIGEIRKRFGTEEEYNQELAKQGLSEGKFREQVKEQLMIIKLIDQEVKAKVVPPTDSEIEDFYKQNESEMVEPEQVRVRHILIKVDENTDKKKALGRIREILKEVKKGETSFAELAKKYSEGPAAPRGGDLGFFIRGQMVPKFEEAAFALNVGEISNVVETEYGYHIIQCIEKKASEKKSLEEIQDYLRNFIFQKRMEERYEKWLRGLRDKASITKSEID